MMRAAVMRNKEIIVTEVADLSPGQGEALVKTLACGICGSDLHALHHGEAMVEAQRESGGPLVYDTSRDVVLGHEFSAEILELGRGAPSHLKTGDLVCSYPVLMSGREAKAIGFSNDVPGGYAENMLLTSSLLLQIPNGLSAELAALTEPMAVGRHAVEKAAGSLGGSCLVIGCGPVGLAVIAALKQKGCGPIVASDFSPRRRELAELLGADEVINPADLSPYDSWRAISTSAKKTIDKSSSHDGLRPKAGGIIFECVGVPGVIEEIMTGAMRGTSVVVVGVCMQQDSFHPMVAIGKELNLQFVLGYSAREFRDTLRAIAEGELNVEKLITGKVGINGIAQAFDDLADPELHAKVIVEPWR
jgi:threonine dehydrogenase-like Zn-dependent dehydrogenase|tara:strand:- start:1482 stop:2564 length:1083 start_codon:yes stop_codon:yes gene_type:complete